jgi:hypothetical protein
VGGNFFIIFLEMMLTPCYRLTVAVISFSSWFFLSVECLTTTSYSISFEISRLGFNIGQYKLKCVVLPVFSLEANLLTEFSFAGLHLILWC